MIATLAARFTVDDWWVGPLSIVVFGVFVIVAAHALDRLTANRGRKL